jgi:nucleoid-associated protein YgaU
MAKATPNSFYTTQQGDSFASIAQQAYTNSNQWPVIASANPNVPITDVPQLFIPVLTLTTPKPGFNYLVQKTGETFSGIANTVYSDAKLGQFIASVNKIPAANTMTAGQVLFIPMPLSPSPKPGFNYIVQQSDKPIGIAQAAYRGDGNQWQLIANANNTTAITAGHLLFIPMFPAVPRPGSNYLVQQSDTLLTIAQQAYNDSSQSRMIISVNNITFKAGQLLFIPMAPSAKPKQGFSYIVQQGDKPTDIAQAAYRGDGKQWQLIANANNIISPNTINVGQVLFIPTAASPATTATKPKIEVGSTYTTVPNDTLWDIAQRAYRNPTLWHLILDYPANKKAIGSNAKNLQPKTPIFIPPIA